MNEERKRKRERQRTPDNSSNSSADDDDDDDDLKELKCIASEATVIEFDPHTGCPIIIPSATDDDAINNVEMIQGIIKISNLPKPLFEDIQDIHDVIKTKVRLQDMVPWAGIDTNDTTRLRSFGFMGDEALTRVDTPNSSSGDRHGSSRPLIRLHAPEKIGHEAIVDEIANRKALCILHKTKEPRRIIPQNNTNSTTNAATTTDSNNDRSSSSNNNNDTINNDEEDWKNGDWRWLAPSLSSPLVEVSDQKHQQRQHRSDDTNYINPMDVADRLCNFVLRPIIEQQQQKQQHQQIDPHPKNINEKTTEGNIRAPAVSVPGNLLDRTIFNKDQLIAYQTNLHNGAKYLSAHMDAPLHEGFGKYICTIAIRGGPATILLIGKNRNDDDDDNNNNDDDGDDHDHDHEQPAWKFQLQEGEGYILSNNARNICLHAVLGTTTTTATALHTTTTTTTNDSNNSNTSMDADANNNITAAYQNDDNNNKCMRESLNLRFGLHTQKEAEEDIKMHYPDLW